MVFYYSLETGCPLNESQLNAYLDILSHNKQNSYLIPLFMEISGKFDVKNINNALETLLDAHLILNY